MFWERTLKIGIFVTGLIFFVEHCIGEGCKNMAFLQEDKNGYLQNHTHKTIIADNLRSCRIHCYLNNDCVSVNYHRGTSTCEMNDSDHLQHPGDLIRKDGYVYQSTENACQTTPCPASTTCKPNFVTGGYKCLCPFEYDGPPRADCEFPYQKLGCFKDVYKKNALPELILTPFYTDHHSYEAYPYGEVKKGSMDSMSVMRWFISRCAFKAKEKGYQFFGIQNTWECWSGPDGEKSYSKYGKADQTRCNQGNFTAGCNKHDQQFCFGLEHANYVYKRL